MQKRIWLRNCFLLLLLAPGPGWVGVLPAWSAGTSLFAQDQQNQKEQQSPATEPDRQDADNQSAPDLTEQVVRDVLQPLQAGMQGRSLRQVLATFDQQNMVGYAELRDQITGFFRHYEDVRFRYQVLQVSADKDRGSAVAEIDMEAQALGGGQVPVQRSTQMRFQIKLEPKGWKITGFQPNDFFAQ